MLSFRIEINAVKDQLTAAFAQYFTTLFTLEIRSVFLHLSEE